MVVRNVLVKANLNTMADIWNLRYMPWEFHKNEIKFQDYFYLYILFKGGLQNFRTIATFRWEPKFSVLHRIQTVYGILNLGQRYMNLVSKLHQCQNCILHRENSAPSAIGHKTRNFAWSDLIKVLATKLYVSKNTKFVFSRLTPMVSCQFLCQADTYMEDIKLPIVITPTPNPDQM